MCERCGKSGERLVVHHIKPYRECKDASEANSMANLIVLCESCHGKADYLGRTQRRGVIKRWRK